MADVDRDQPSHVHTLDSAEPDALGRGEPRRGAGGRPSRREQPTGDGAGSSPRAVASSGLVPRRGGFDRLSFRESP
jgi:hypothetical protein